MFLSVKLHADVGSEPAGSPNVLFVSLSGGPGDEASGGEEGAAVSRGLDQTPGWRGEDDQHPAAQTGHL